MHRFCFRCANTGLFTVGSPWVLLPAPPRLPALIQLRRVLLVARVVFALVVAVGVVDRALAVDLETIESEHYRFHTNLSPDELRPFARHMDTLHVEYTRRFRELIGRDRGRRKQNLYLVATQQDYLDVLADEGIDGTGSGGMFFTNRGGSALATWVHHRSRRSVIQTLQHEGFHQFANEYLGRQLPLWVNEGLAVYFEQAALIKGRLRIGIAEPHRIAAIQGALEADLAFPIQDLITITSEQWLANLHDPIRGSLQYTQSWSICYFLVHGDNGRYQAAFNRYLEFVAAGRLSDTAFRAAFQTGNYAALEARWREFVEQELKPDAYTVMLSRLEFLATGALAMHNAGRALPDSLEGLLAMLNEADFRTRNSQSAAVMSAADPGIGTYVGTRDATYTFDYELEETGGLPRITAPRARPRAGIRWHLADDGQWSFEVSH